MAHSLPSAAATLTSISNYKTNTPVRVPAFHQGSPQELNQILVSRRSAALGLAVVVLNGDNKKANAAGRRVAAPPAEEKKDPNVSGVMAKVLASKRRKEAMKESMAKLRERGKLLVSE